MDGTKSGSTAFHLNNLDASKTLNIKVKNKILRSDPSPKYLGVILDRQLNYSKCLKGCANKDEYTSSNVSQHVGRKASESGCRREGTLNTTFHNTDDSKTDESSRVAVQPQARRQASASFADLRYCTEYRVKGDQFQFSPQIFGEIGDL
ncbi:hypothetical protein ElyMa_002949100 [Elysia marginata]|uniref:Uncharacterized protein n=1 Tax=Elysia marginata TaxID=1093978 RepID=A0AAV4I9R6_9GAST|nr:hypothetical protein ElyMa_002949100 [Elysia marginata]